MRTLGYFVRNSGGNFAYKREGGLIFAIFVRTCDVNGSEITLTKIKKSLFSKIL